MSDDTTTKRERRDIPTRTKDTFGDIQESLGDIQHALSRRDTGWITAEIADGFRSQIRRFANTLALIDNVLDEISPPPLRTLSINVGGDLPREPTGMLKRAMSMEEKAASDD